MKYLARNPRFRRTERLELSMPNLNPAPSGLQQNRDRLFSLQTRSSHAKAMHRSAEWLRDQPAPERSRALDRSATASACPAGSPWCDSPSKRVFDATVAAVALVLLLPVLLGIALLVRLDSPGEAIFQQRRVGRYGVEFTIWKFRTMFVSSGSLQEGSKRSGFNDPRTSRFGRLLRRYKLDELPQLVNVLRGEMSLIGPRPRIRGHQSVDLSFRPGITGAATLAFAAEEALLENIALEHLEECHSRLISPKKLELDLRYMARATFWSDLQLIWMTLKRAGRYTHIDQLGGWQPHLTRGGHGSAHAFAPTPAGFPPVDSFRRVAQPSQQL